MLAELLIHSDASSNVEAKTVQVTKKVKQSKAVTRSRVSHARGVRNRGKHNVSSRFNKGGARATGIKARTTTADTKESPVAEPNDIIDKITVEEKIEMLTTKELDEEVHRGSAVLEHQRVVVEDKGNGSAPSNGKLKIGVNAELINGVADGMNVEIELVKTDTKDCKLINGPARSLWLILRISCVARPGRDS